MRVTWICQMLTVWFGLVQIRMVQSQSFDVDGTKTSSSSLSLNPSEPNWVRTNHNIIAHEQEQQQLVINDAIHFITQVQDSFHQPEILRRLQQECNTTEGTDNPCVLQTPEEVCESYNNATAGILTCTCSRFGTKDTQVDCAYNVPQCNSDNTTCYVGSISQILNIALQSRVVTTCTIFIESFVETVPLNTELCIRVFPFEDGNYETISSCSASLQPAGSGSSSSDDVQVCNSCTICETPDTSSTDSKNMTTNPNISFNCCNIITDIRQTCVPVSATNGVAIPQYDTITPENQGTCASHADHTRTTSRWIQMLYWLISTTLMLWMIL